MSKSTSFRMTPEAKQLLESLAKKLGVSQAAIIEMAIRKFAQHENVIQEKRKMHIFTAWQAHTGSVAKWLEELLEAGEIGSTDIVWGGPDGGYAVGEGTIEEDESIAEYIDEGSVAEWLEEADKDTLRE